MTSLEVKKELQHSEEPALKSTRFSSDGNGHTAFGGNSCWWEQLLVANGHKSRLGVDNDESSTKGREDLTVLENRWHSEVEVSREEGVCITSAKLEVDNGQGRAQQEHQCHN